MSVSEASVFTSVLNNQVVTITQGARTIDIKNTGSTPIFFIGNSSQSGIVLAPVSVSVSQSYSFVDVGKPYPNITIDCTGGNA